MAEYADPPLWDSAPADGQVPVYNAARDRLVPTAIAAIGSTLTVPQTGTALPAETSSPPEAVTSTQNSTAAATDLPTSEALANSLQASYNALQEDFVDLQATCTAMQADISTLFAALETLTDAVEAAGILTVT